MADAQGSTPNAPLSEDQIEAELKQFPEWSLVGETIQRTYQFKDFAASMKFINDVAAQAESAQHHPDMLVRYGRVTLTLATHDAGGITSKDFALAGKADGIAAKIVGVKSAARGKK